MLRNISIVLFCWAFLHLMSEPDYAVLFSEFINYVTAHQTFILATGIMGSALLVVISYLCSAIGMYILMYLVAKVFFELSQLTVCFVSVASLIGWFAAQRNIWLDVPVVLYVLLYTFLCASALSLYIFDFNYPLKDKFASHAALPVVATILTGVIMVVF